MKIVNYDLLKNIPHGIKSIVEWLGSGGQVVDPGESQRRADICNHGMPAGLPCPCNIKEFDNGIVEAACAAMEEVVADVVKRHLEVKNALELRVKGEKQLGICSKCGCQLKLLVHEPPERMVKQMQQGERESLPDHCWKKKL
jgi:hypothetical protein